MNRFKGLFKPQTQDEAAILEGLDKMQGLDNLRKPMNSGTEIPQMPSKQPSNKMNLAPRESMLSDTPVNNPMLISDQNAKIDAADRMRQMQTLEDLENLGAFEEPDSEVNQRAAKLRALLGK